MYAQTSRKQVGDDRILLRACAAIAARRCRRGCRMQVARARRVAHHLIGNLPKKTLVPAVQSDRADPVPDRDPLRGATRLCGGHRPRSAQIRRLIFAARSGHDDGTRLPRHVLRHGWHQYGHRRSPA